MGDRITLGDNLDAGPYVRAKGFDFGAGDALSAPRVLSPANVALLAAMNVPRVTVRRAPVVAILATGDELAQPGEDPGPDQIIASNSYGLAAMLRTAGAIPRLLPIARDSVPSLVAAFGQAEGADLLVTIGGASVGDHDLVAKAAETLGLERQFYKVAMRPGKPLMAGRLGEMVLVGLPGNPVSAMVCGEIFLRPMLDVMLGFPARPRARLSGPLAHDIGPNGPREHYMRARLEDGQLSIFGRQDSALLSVLSDANALVVRAPTDPARAQGEMIEYLTI